MKNLNNIVKKIKINYFFYKLDDILFFSNYIYFLDINDFNLVKKTYKANIKNNQYEINIKDFNDLLFKIYISKEKSDKKRIFKRKFYSKIFLTNFNNLLNDIFGTEIKNIEKILHQNDKGEEYFSEMMYFLLLYNEFIYLISYIEEKLKIIK